MPRSIMRRPLDPHSAQSGTNVSVHSASRMSTTQVELSIRMENSTISSSRLLPGRYRLYPLDFRRSAARVHHRNRGVYSSAPVARKGNNRRLSATSCACAATTCSSWALPLVHSRGGSRWARDPGRDQCSARVLGRLSTPRWPPSSCRGSLWRPWQSRRSIPDHCSNPVVEAWPLARLIDGPDLLGGKISLGSCAADCTS